MIEKQTIQAEVATKKLLIEQDKLELEKTKVQLQIEQLRKSLKIDQSRG